jgi:hypothetical protein
MQYFGTFDLANANSGGGPAYPHNKLYFQIWLTELQARMSKNDNYKHIVIHGVNPGCVKTNILVTPPTSEKVSRPERLLEFLLKYVGIDSQQGSLAITNAATAAEWGQKYAPDGGGKMCGGGGRYANRIWEEEPMPQTSHPECRREIWEFVNKELKVEERGLLTGLKV